MTEQSQDSKEVVGSMFIEFLTITVKYRRFLFLFVFIITVATSIYALLAPRWYKSITSVFPAEKNDLLSTISGISNLARGFSASKGLAALTGKNSESDKYLAILKSGTMTDDVIKKFELRKEYGRENDYYEYVVKEWESNLELDVQDEGNLTITVYDQDPKKAADIANYMVDRLNEMNTSLSITNAKANREFVEKRYLQNIDDINKLESDMKLFQKKYGVIAVTQQLEATVKTMASIELDLYKKEIEYNVMKQTLGVDHPMTTNAHVEIDEMRRKINQLNYGTDASQNEMKLLIPFKDAPELGNEYLKIYRNLEIQYKILEFIQPLYEQAKIEEIRNTPSVLVLDKAGPAERKSKPHGTIYALAGFIGSFGIGFLYIFTKELFNRFKASYPEKYVYFQEAVMKDVRRFFLRKKR